MIQKCCQEYQIKNLNLTLQRLGKAVMKKYKLLLILSSVLLNTPNMCHHENDEIDLRLYEISRISQNGEDGVLEKIFQLIGTTNKYYVEFGAGNGHYCSNVKYLREKYNWTGLLMDGACSNSMNDDLLINLHKEFITAENICNLFKKYNVPHEFDLISIDIDRNDFYVWKTLSAAYKPRVVIIEFNAIFNSNEDKVIKYEANAIWDGRHYFGASILALFNLARKLGYSLVYEESAAVNLFFIRDDILTSSMIKFKNVNNVTKIHKPNPLRKTCDSKIIAEIFTSSVEAIQ